MTLTYEHTPGRIQMKEDGVAFFDTDYYPVMLDTTVEVTGQTITFPDLLKGIGYAFARGLQGADMYRSCHSFITLGPQEWGPATMAPAADDPSHVLSESVLTTVPASCDGLLVQVKLSRTSAPSQIGGIDIPVLPKTGEWVTAPGGSLPLEYLFPLSRQIDVVLQSDENGDPVYNLDGTRNVVLQRRQSVNRKRYTFYRDDTTNSGWTAHGAGVEKYGHLVHSIQQKGPNFTAGDGADYAYGQSNQCSLTDPTNYSSVYSADIRITPMYMNEAPVNSGSTSKAGFFIGHQTSGGGAAADASVHTFSDFYIGADNSTRHVYVWVAGAFDTTVRVVNGVTINGVAMSSLYTFSNSGQLHSGGLFVASVPTGTMVDVEVTFAGNAQTAYCGMFVAYNLDSPLTPAQLYTSDFQSTNSSPGLSVPTSGGEITFFAASQRIRGPFPTTGGAILPGFVGPDQVEEPIEAAPNSGNGYIAGWAATHTPTGSTLATKAVVDTDAGDSSDTSTSGNARWMGMTLT